MFLTLQIHTLERLLLSLAHEAWHSVVPASSESVRDEALLAQAYAHCREITAIHSRSFYLASSLLPADKRRAIHALYAFCRTADDLVDRPSNDSQMTLAAWREQVLASPPPLDDLVAVACPMCHANIDGRQSQMEGLEPLPALYFTQLMALAFDLPEQAALKFNMVDARPLLKERGLL